MLGAPSHLLPPFPYSIAHNINVVEGAELELGGGAELPLTLSPDIWCSVYMLLAVFEKLCSNSKNVKVVIFDFEKKRKIRTLKH